jgi:lysophospholipase L1-like esterase
MGDSITLGYTTSPGPVYSYTSGFRQYIYASLKANGKNPVMVGHLNDVSQGLSPTLAGNYHSGIGGSTSSQWLPSGANYLRGLVEPAIAAQGLVPHLVWFMLGANEIDVPDNAAHQLAVIDLINADYPLAWIVSCSRTPQASSGSSVSNGALLTGIQARIASGVNILFFDAFQTLTNSTSDMVDGLHPTVSGYQKIGNAAAAFITASLAAGKL